MTRSKKVVLFVVAVTLAAFAVNLAFAISRAKRTERQIHCVHHLKLIAMQLRMYADKHDGAFPDTWSRLVTDLQISPDAFDIFVCPNLSREYKKTHGVPSGPEDIDELSSYVLVSGLHITDDKDTIIAYEKGDNHGGIGHSVLYLDGRGGWDPPSNWR
jgi:hypothetical protein